MLKDEFAMPPMIDELPDPDKGEKIVDLPPPPWLVEDPDHGLPPNVRPPIQAPIQPLIEKYVVVEVAPRET